MSAVTHQRIESINAVEIANAIGVGAEKRDWDDMVNSIKTLNKKLALCAKSDKDGVVYRMDSELAGAAVLLTALDELCRYWQPCHDQYREVLAQALTSLLLVYGAQGNTAIQGGNDIKKLKRRMETRLKHSQSNEKISPQLHFQHHLQVVLLVLESMETTTNWSNTMQVIGVDAIKAIAACSLGAFVGAFIKPLLELAKEAYRKCKQKNAEGKLEKLLVFECLQVLICSNSELSVCQQALRNATTAILEDNRGEPVLAYAAVSINSKLPGQRVSVEVLNDHMMRYLEFNSFLWRSNGHRIRAAAIRVLCLWYETKDISDAVKKRIDEMLADRLALETKESVKVLLKQKSKVTQASEVLERDWTKREDQYMLKLDTINANVKKLTTSADRDQDHIQHLVDEMRMLMKQLTMFASAYGTLNALLLKSNRFINTCYIKQADIRDDDFVPTRLSSSSTAMNDCEHILSDFLQSKEKHVLFITGPPGSGKSMMMHALEKAIWDEWDEETESCWTPILAPIPQLGMEFTDSKAFACARIDWSDRKPGPLVFLLDGYDGICHDNLRTTNLVEFFGPGANRKIIITSRPHLRELFFSGQRDKSKLQLLHIAPWNESQVQTFLSLYVEQTKCEKPAEWYYRYISKTPNLSELAKTPFLLYLITEILPSLVRGNVPLGTLGNFRLYEMFTDRWFTTEAALVIDNPQRLSDEQLVKVFRVYHQRIARKMDTLGVDVIDEKKAPEFFSSQIDKISRRAALMRKATIKDTVLHEFLHGSLKGYFLVKYPELPTDNSWWQLGGPVTSLGVGAAQLGQGATPMLLPASTPVLPIVLVTMGLLGLYMRYKWRASPVLPDALTERLLDPVMDYDLIALLVVRAQTDENFKKQLLQSRPQNGEDLSITAQNVTQVVERL